MGLLRKKHRQHTVLKPHCNALKGPSGRSRLCRFEAMESRQLLSATVAPLQIGAVYFEDSNKFDEVSVLQGTSTNVADLLEIGFTGGADATQLTELRIDANNTFFDTASTSPGAYGSFPLTIISHDGFEILSASVVDGGTALVLTFSGFNAGEKLVFSVDVDEQGNLQPNAVVEGAEFEGAALTATFTAPHMNDITTPGLVFYDDFDLAATGLEDLLPNNNYDNAAALAFLPEGCSPGPVYTAGAQGSVQQTPLPITLSGTVYSDPNANNRRETGELGIAGVSLALYELQNGSYVATGKTTLTDADGNYEFTGLLPGTYRVVETQPAGYLSVGSTPGTVNGATRGFITSVDVLSGINLDGGEDSIHNDFAEVVPASISGYVYVDANNNGVFDAGETPIAGAILTLLNAAGGSTGSTAVTDASGFYQFEGLMPGGYGVAEAQPAGYIDGLDAAGTAGGSAHNPGDLLDGVVLVGGQSGLNYNFGELLPGCISGYVYVDANNNGVFDAGESPIAGVELALLDASGNPTGETRVTDETGFYRFCGLAPGLYGVIETQPTGYLDGLDAPGTTGGTAHNPGDLISAIPLTSGAKSKDNNFGELLPASIAGQVFADLDGDNVLDANEPLLAGVTVYLLDSSGNRIGSTTTDSNGKYAFVHLRPGVYGVEEVQPANYLEGSNRVGSAGGNRDGVNRTLQAQLGSGVNGINYDFWEVVPAKISGYVFQDGPTITVQEGEATPHIPSVRDGKLTADDKRLSGVTLYLCDASGTPLLDAQGRPIATVTDANGYYEFTMLSPGYYSIVEVQPEGYLPGMDTAGSKGGLVVNRYAAIDSAVLSTLTVDPSGSAIVRIFIQPGDAAVEYNFSEVLLVTERPNTPPPYYPPHVPTPTLPPPTPLPYLEYRPVGSPYYLMPDTVKQLIFGGAGSPGGYTWHLSIIDAGQPRHVASGNEFAQAANNTLFDPVSWSGAEVNQSEFVLADGDGVPVKRVQFGLSGATPVSGDWDGTGITKIGVFLDGLWFLDLNGNGVWDEGDLWVKLGKKADQPVAGDWNGDGKTDIGIFGPTWIGDMKAIAVEPGLPDSQNPPTKARPKNVPPDAAEAAVGWRTLKKGHRGDMRSDLIDHVFQYGDKGDIAVTGDWNGDGIATIGVFRNGTWFLDMDGDGRWSQGDVMVEYGQDGDIPVVGDWTGDGIAKLGVYRNGTFHLDVNNNRQADAADKVFALGGAGDKPVVGDWDGNGVDNVGIYRQGASADVPLQASRE